VTVPSDVLPPTTVAGERAMEYRIGGSIVSNAEAVTLPTPDVTVATFRTETGEVVATKSTLSCPSGIVTVAGTRTSGVLLVTRTVLPPLGAGPLSVTVPVVELPPATRFGLRVTEITPRGIRVRSAL